MESKSTMAIVIDGKKYVLFIWVRILYLNLYGNVMSKIGFKENINSSTETLNLKKPQLRIKTCWKVLHIRSKKKKSIQDKCTSEKMNRQHNVQKQKT